MKAKFTSGDTVQTPFGKGVVREVRNNGRLMVDVRGIAMVVEGSVATLCEAGRKRSQSGSKSAERELERSRPKRVARRVLAEVDLHGLTVEEAMDRVQALHRRLRETSSVRRFGIDPRNEGVTIVRL